MMSFRAMTVVPAMFIPFCGSALRADESDCVSYLRQDIHNKLVVVDNATGKQVSSSSLCKNSGRTSSSGLSVQYAGVGVGANQASSLAEALCDNRLSQSDLSNSQSVYRSVVDPAIVQASLECFRLNAKGLHYSTHTNADTHTVAISLSYNGPNSINVTDIVASGNAKCVGQFYDSWSSSQTKKVSLDPKSQGMVCTPIDSTSKSGNSDVEAGAITIMTDAGPIYAEIPRRFSPSLEDQFHYLESVVASLQTDLAEQKKATSLRILAAASVRSGKIVSISDGASLDLTSGKFSFPNPSNLKFVPIMSEISATGAYLTESCYSRSIQNDYFVLWQGAQDTSGRNHPPIDCTVTVVGFNP